MNRPDLYNKANEMQRRDAEIIMKQMSTKIQWRHDGWDSLIDVGSGCGGVLMDLVYPHMPNNFRRLVCSDLNPKMVNYAAAKFGHIEGAEFKVLDIAAKSELPSDLRQQFDHVTSFYALMWVQDQRQVLQNIFDLLRSEGGDCLLMSLASHPTFNVYKLLGQVEKWSRYIYFAEASVAQLKYSASEYANLMTEVGFVDCKVELQQKVCVYDSLEVFKGANYNTLLLANMRAVNPFLNRMPTSMHDDFMNAVIELVVKGIGLQMVDNAKIPIPYTLLVVYARKQRTVDA